MRIKLPDGREFPTALESAWMDGWEPLFYIEVSQAEYDAIEWND